MINDVRNTVLAILNKENRGSITPDQTNLYAIMAQRERFLEYFFDYSTAINKRNRRIHSSGHSDIPERLEEVIEFFTEPTVLTFNAISLQFEIPEETYKLGTVTYNGTTIVDKVSNGKVLYLIKTLDTTPSVDYPAYTVYGDEIKLYPITIVSNVSALRTRFPKDPKWTYLGFSGGDPLFNQSANDYQDFELPEDDFYNLVSKMCQYAGVQIREPEVAQFMRNTELQDDQKQT